MSNEVGSKLVSVRFCETDLECIFDESTQDVWVSLRRACEGIGIDYPTQFTKLKEKSWACIGQSTIHDSTGRKQQMTMIHLDSLPMWLATIDENRVAPEVKEDLIKYQTDAARVLREHFLGVKKTPAPSQGKVSDYEMSQAIAYRDAVTAKIPVLKQEEKQKRAELKILRGELKEIRVAKNKAHQEVKHYNSVKIPALIEKSVMEGASVVAREMARKAGVKVPELDSSTLLLATDDVPEKPLKAQFKTLCSRATYLKYGEEPSSHHFAWMTLYIYREYDARYHRNITTCAKNRKMSVIEYAESEGFLDALVKVASVIVQELEATGSSASGLN